MTHRGPFQPLLFCDSVRAVGVGWGDELLAAACPLPASVWCLADLCKDFTARQAGVAGEKPRVPAGF